MLATAPRNGGDQSRAVLADQGVWPAALGVAATPSGGSHEFIPALGVGSRDAFRPGIDVRGGRPDGTSRGFVFIAPTVKLSKVTGVLQPYRWVTRPSFAARPNDPAGQALASLVNERDVRAPAARASAAAVDAAGSSPIPAGTRRRTVLSEAGRLRGKGVSYTEACERLRAVWSACEQPAGDPFPWAEAEALLQDAYNRWPPNTPAQQPTGAPSPDRFFDPRDGLRVASLASSVAAVTGPFALGPGDELWVYRDGVYIRDGGEAVRRGVVEHLGERHRASHLTNVVQVLKAQHALDGSLLNLPNGPGT